MVTVSPQSGGPARVLIVDDHPIVRERLAELIGQEVDLVVCGEAEGAREAMGLVASLRPDVAVVDIMLRDSYGIELVKALRESHPGLPVLVLSMYDEVLFGERALRAGARGYLNKQAATRAIVPAIRKVLAGGVYVSEAMDAAILRKIVGGGGGTGGAADVLTDREFEVFQMLGQGKGVRQIADELFLSVKTVEAHREHIKRKMSLKSSAELVHYAIRYVAEEGRSAGLAGRRQEDRGTSYGGRANA